jgi:hypothetical protein
MSDHWVSGMFACRLPLILLMICSVGTVAAEERVIFSRDIRPILSDKCFHCHGPDETARQAQLRFDLVNDLESPFRDRDGSTAIKPKDLEESAIWYRLTTDDTDQRMPPAHSHKKPMTEAQRDLIRRWILQGAEYEEFWAFVSPKPQRTPNTRDPHWGASRIDQFVLSRLDGVGLSPNPRAEKRSLIRRATFDLTGLPPTKEDIQRFLQDRSANAYQRLIDRLMASPEFGEHMAKYWLDLVRFSDTNGIHHDHYREMTPYRDWVIRSFNENLGFDDFITYQLAGDLFDQPTHDQQIASGFNRLHLVIDKGTAVPEESFARNVIDRVTAFGTAFLGLTLQCAVCHDHKYDPITQRDFYQLYAFFNNIDSTPETPGKSTHPPFLKLPTVDQHQQLASLKDRIVSVKAELESLPVERPVEDSVKDSAGESPEEPDRGSTRRGSLGGDSPAKAKHRLREQCESELTALEEEKRVLETVIPVTLVMKERTEVRPTFVLVRGAYDQPGDQVDRGTPAFLPPLKAAGRITTRMDLAKWLISAEHPLPARVTVNRFWQQFFGTGLVKTSEDFGAQGEWPSHPELLDDLAVRFVQSGWNVKELIRCIVLSQTYQQSSKARTAEFRADPENRLLARGSRFRLDSEMIRDQILAVSGLLNKSMYGRSVKPPQPPNLWKTVSMVSSSTYSFEPDQGDKIHRRSLYSFWKRALPPPQMTIFDAPTRESCIARRERTNTPLQALVLMNERQYFRAARSFARQLLGDKSATDEQRIQTAYEAVTSQLPDATERDVLSRGLQVLRGTYQDDLPSARTVAAEPELSDAEQVEIAAYTMLVNSLFNLDITKTRE